MYVGPLLDGGLEAGHEVLWGPPRPSLHARDRDEDKDVCDKDNADVGDVILKLCTNIHSIDFEDVFLISLDLFSSKLARK